MSDGHMGYIFQPDDSTVKIFTNSGHSTLFQIKAGSFSPALRMREWLKIHTSCAMPDQTGPEWDNSARVSTGRGNLGEIIGKP
jgi:hypothetical protein